LKIRSAKRNFPAFGVSEPWAGETSRELARRALRCAALRCYSPFRIDTATSEHTAILRAHCASACARRVGRRHVAGGHLSPRRAAPAERTAAAPRPFIRQARAPLARHTRSVEAQLGQLSAELSRAHVGAAEWSARSSTFSRALATEEDSRTSWLNERVGANGPRPARPLRHRRSIPRHKDGDCNSRRQTMGPPSGEQSIRPRAGDRRAPGAWHVHVDAQAVERRARVARVCGAGGAHRVVRGRLGAVEVRAAARGRVDAAPVQGRPRFVRGPSAPIVCMCTLRGRRVGCVSPFHASRFGPPRCCRALCRPLSA